MKKFVFVVLFFCMFFGSYSVFSSQSDDDNTLMIYLEKLVKQQLAYKSPDNFYMALCIDSIEKCLPIESVEDNFSKDGDSRFLKFTVLLVMYSDDKEVKTKCNISYVFTNSFLTVERFENNPYDSPKEDEISVDIACEDKSFEEVFFYYDLNLKYTHLNYVLGLD